MINKILGDLVQVLRGKNGNIFLLVIAAVAILFFLKIVAPLMWLLMVGGLVFLAFKYLQNRS
jgi:uncharacterized membrane protein YccC